MAFSTEEKKKDLARLLESTRGLMTRKELSKATGYSKWFLDKIDVEYNPDTAPRITPRKTVTKHRVLAPSKTRFVGADVNQQTLDKIWEAKRQRGCTQTEIVKEALDYGMNMPAVVEQMQADIEYLMHVANRVDWLVKELGCDEKKTKTALVPLQRAQ